MNTKSTNKKRIASSIYDPLGEYLKNLEQSSVTLTFEQIEKIIGFTLPASSYTYRAWWSNGGHSHSYAWLNSGYEVDTVMLNKKIVKFRRTGKEVYAETGKYKKNNLTVSHDHHEETITVCGYEFTYIQDIVPEKSSDGRVVEYAPQSSYANHLNKHLHYFGKGTFCRFSINADNLTGVYLWVVDDQIIYIGETVKLAQRFNTGYGYIEGINCYEGGQTTNCKMNKVVLNLAKKGKTIKLYFFKTEDHKRVELELLSSIHTQYNIKDNI